MDQSTTSAPFSPGSFAYTAGSSTTGGGGTGFGNSNSSFPSPPKPSGVAPETLAAQKLEKRLEQIQNSIDDYYEDRDLQLVNASASNKNSRPLPALAAHLKRIPVSGEQQVFPEQKKKVKRQVKEKDSFTALGRILQSKGHDKKILRLDAIVAGISMLGLLLMLINSTLGWIPRTEVTAAPAPPPTVLNASANVSTAAPFATVDPRSLSLSEQLGPTTSASIIILNWVMFVSSFASIAAIVYYYRYLLNVKRSEWCRLNGLEVMDRKKAFNFWKSVLPRYMFGEIFIHLIFPYPWYMVLQDPNARYLELFMLLRTYTVLRLLHHRAPMYRYRHDIVRGNNELRTANFQVRFSDTMKVYFYENTVIAGALMYAFVALVGGFAVFVAERESNNGLDPVPDFPGNPGFGFNTWFDGIYFMVVSVRTIGYGDLRPITIVGRILTICFQFVGMSVEALLGSVAINKIAKSKEEKIIDEYLQSFHAWHELRVASVMLIQASWKSSLRYQYLHHRRSDGGQESAIDRAKQKKNMERVLRMQRRRREFLHRVVVGGKTFTLPTYEDQHAFQSTRAPGLSLKNPIRMETDKGALNKLALAQILRVLSTAKGKATREIDAVTSGGSGNGNDLYEKMPFMRKADVASNSYQLIQQYKKLFTQDVDVSRWGKNNNSQQLPPGFKPQRTFTATKKVIGKNGERRVPIGQGHKANIQLQALKQFRAARQDFKATLASSSDHVVDTKLLLCYELLVGASRKLQRNTILLDGLRKVANLELDSVEQLLTLSLSGGNDPPKM